MDPTTPIKCHDCDRPAAFELHTEHDVRRLCRCHLLDATVDGAHAVIPIGSPEPADAELLQRIDATDEFLEAVRRSREVQDRVLDKVLDDVYADPRVLDPRVLDASTSQLVPGGDVDQDEWEEQLRQLCETDR